MNDQLSNIVQANGTYNGLPTSLTSEAVVVTLVSGLAITKTADKVSWANGNLTYTITITNQGTESYAAPVLTDVLDTSLVDFVEDSVFINGEKADTSKYQYATNTLTITLDDIAPSNSSTVTFQVKKKV